MKLLVVEDEKKLSDSICAYLGSEQFACEAAYDYPAALEKIAKHSALECYSEFKGSRPWATCNLCTFNDSID